MSLVCHFACTHVILTSCYILISSHAAQSLSEDEQEATNLQASSDTKRELTDGDAGAGNEVLANIIEPGTGLGSSSSKLVAFTRLDAFQNGVIR